jgi:hypothetical protein
MRRLRCVDVHGAGALTGTRKNEALGVLAPSATGCRPTISTLCARAVAAGAFAVRRVRSAAYAGPGCARILKAAAASEARS